MPSWVISRKITTCCSDGTSSWLLPGARFSYRSRAEATPGHLFSPLAHQAVQTQKRLGNNRAKGLKVWVSGFMSFTVGLIFQTGPSVSEKSVYL